ncbi:hypothetical protein HanRHA438_Chr03g0128861 [Helianthus annuus]|nr:hypothetical protein HanRHA438_Chr03g0128861 [Helianthus annuus]
MAEQPVDHPSPSHSANSEFLAGKPPTKRTATTSATPPPKRPHTTTTTASNSDETKFTASSVLPVEQQPQEEHADDELLPDDLEVLEELEKSEVRYGGNPAQYPLLMNRFCFSYSFLGVGNDDAWEAKIQRLRNKFKNQSEQSVRPDQMEEFVLWKKMFDRVPAPADADDA